MTEKIHNGRIKNWSKRPVDDGLGFQIVGEFLDHPVLRGEGHTSAVVVHDEKTGEIETRNSRYQLVDHGEPSRRKGWPNKGDKYRFLGVGGYDWQLAEARKFFEVGKEYEVEDCEIGDWHHDIIFVDIPGRYNGVMFEPAL